MLYTDTHTHVHTDVSIIGIERGREVCISIEIIRQLRFGRSKFFKIPNVCWKSMRERGKGKKLKNEERKNLYEANEESVCYKFFRNNIVTIAI